MIVGMMAPPYCLCKGHLIPRLCLNVRRGRAYRNSHRLSPASLSLARLDWHLNSEPAFQVLRKGVLKAAYLPASALAASTISERISRRSPYSSSRRCSTARNSNEVMSAVDLQQIKACLGCPFSCQAPLTHNVLDLPLGKGPRRGLIRARGQGGGRHQFWPACLPARVGNLDAHDGPLPAAEVYQPPEGFYLPIVPKAKILCADPPPRFHSRGLHDDAPCPPNCPAAIVDVVPLKGKAVLFCRVLAHGRHHDSVRKNNRFEGKGRKQHLPHLGDLHRLACLCRLGGRNRDIQRL